ncbi:bifunctional diguanylate cyclase/phosphodiesterase [Litchfieldella rifensis]|uniref:EAL domain-containing protein n=1 Tax=Litchfieldella rifensis TaxID=762643 RepID=A0ABV7LU87_9GAMM
MTKTNTTDKRHRLSLTWRVITLTSLLLLGLATLFTYIGHDSLTRQFQQSRDAHLKRQEQEIRLALSRSEESLRQLASLVAASPRLGPALASGDQIAIAESLSSQWPTMQLETGLDEILVFDARGRIMASWGEGLADDERPIKNWAQQVMSSETPLTARRCSMDCRQYATVPVLVAGDSVGLVMVSRSLADVTRQAQQVSGSDVALLVSGRPAPKYLAEDRSIEAWNGHLETLTHQEQTLPLLQEAASRTSLQRLLDTPLTLRHQGRYHELTAIRMASSSERRVSDYFLLISDITDQLEAIDQDTRTILVAALGGWLAAELMLLAILWRPMARLRRLAGVLPALAQGGFATARATIQRPRKRLPDEIDVLDGTTLDLANQLETLEDEVRSRGEQLAARVKELAQERDFVGGLLDTARVFILTQDDNGRITLVNDYALSMLGLTHDALIGQCFDAVFTRDDHPLPEPDGSLQEERTLLIPGQQQRTIVWYHAPLSSGDDRSMARISVGLDITERKAAEARLTWLAQRDPLTELYNRRFFQEALVQALAKGHTGAVLFLDLDQFKDVNELSGHHAGDRLLRMVADTLHQEIGREGVIARLGGDEFSMLLEGADAERAIRIAQHIEQLLDNIGLTVAERRHRAIASIGIALYPMHGDTPADLMASADVAMYKAKESGVQRWHLLATIERAKDELQQRVYWVERIRKALRHDGFELMVQPIVRLADRDVQHYEVLLRMRDEDGSLVSPGHFIPIAERSGQIVQLDRWVLRASLKILKAVQHRGISLAINLSGQSLHDDDFKQYLADELAASGADPRHLILEVTETAAVTDFATARGVMHGIRELGCRTALDDFGVGFSSFHYLSQLSVDYIKIDGSFIRSLSTSTDSRVIVRAIADIATGFGKQAIAEFVDQEVLISLLQEYGITYGQGFHLGRPMPACDTFGIIP